MKFDSKIVKKCKSVLQQHYGRQFRGLILHGSFARNQAEDTSDIDLLVLLTSPFDYFEELRQIVDLLYPIQLESKRLISVKPASLEEFERGSIQFYRNAKRDGVMV